MNFEQPKNEIIKTPEIKIKEGVDFVFEQNPELVNTAYEALGFVDFSISEKSGYITLYRAEGETIDREELLPFQKGNAGTWFSPDQKELLRYVSMMKDRKAYKIDIPKSLYDSLNNIAKSNIEMSKGEVQLPIELADKKEILTSDNENVINKNNFKSWIISNRIKCGEITENQRQEAEEVYSKYLENIFPNSKVKDIVYHGTGTKFDSFKKPKDVDSGRDNGIYFTSSIEEKGAKWYAENSGNNNEAYIMSTLINIKNLFKESSMSRVTDIPDGRLEDYKEKGIDGIFGELVSKDGNKILDEYVVFEPEQIHILGSKDDISKFKEFVSSKKDQIK